MELILFGFPHFGGTHAPKCVPNPNFGSVFLFPEEHIRFPMMFPPSFSESFPCSVALHLWDWLLKITYQITIGGPWLDAERRNYHIWVSLSFIQHKSLGIVCSLEVTFLSWFDISVIRKVSKEGWNYGIDPSFKTLSIKSPFVRHVS